MRRPGLLLTLLATLGCSREPSFRDVQKGKVSLDPTERAAIEAILEQADVKPRKLELEGSGSGVVTIEEGHVVGLTFGWKLNDPEPLASLPKLRRLSLGAARFGDLSVFGRHRALEELSLGGWLSQIDSLEGLGGCEALRSISIRGPIESLQPLAACPALEKLHLDRTLLESFATLPPLPELRLLSAAPRKLESLEGLGRVPGLEELVLSDAERLQDLSGSGEHSGLKRLEIYRGGLTTLRGLHRFSGLEELEIESTSVTSFDELKQAGHVALPNLRILKAPLNQLRGSLSLPELPALTTLELDGNQLTGLEELGAQPVLASISLEGNPISDLTPLLELPLLKVLEIKNTEVTEVPKEMYERGIYLRLNESEIEANAWEKTLRDAWNDENFVERLPGGRGTVRRRGGKCTWKAGTFKEAKLSCRMTAESLDGFVWLGLVKVDPLMPTSGGPNRVRIRAKLSVEEGVARVYVRDRIDFKGLAEALAGHTDPSKPLISLGDPRDPDDFRDGYRFAEARPGLPAEVSGEAGLIFDQWVIWLESVDGAARGISYTIEPP